jgi:hypothetical protein
MEAFASLLTVAMECIFDDGIGEGGGLNLVDFDVLGLELFVVEKEAAQHHEAMGRHFGGLVIAVEFRVFEGDGNDLMVLFAAVDHCHEADGPGLDEGEGDDGFLAEDEDVERVVVFSECLGDESVIGGIVDGGVENTVELYESGLLVELVLDAATEGDLDDGVELVRELVSGSDVVPRMDHLKILNE